MKLSLGEKKKLVRFLFQKLSGPRRKRRPDEGDSRPPDCGKTAPLSPSPTHHLVAMRSLPPSDHTYLFDAD